MQDSLHSINVKAATVELYQQLQPFIITSKLVKK